MNSYLKGLLCCLLATVSWGGMFPVMTHALTYIDPFNFTTFRYGIAGIAFALLLLFREGQNSFRLKGEAGGWLGCLVRWVLLVLVFWSFWASRLRGPGGHLLHPL